MHFKNITINNFRGINKLALEDFQRFNLFVGKNNRGKTTVLEALFLSAGPSNPDLSLAINRFRGLQTIDTNSFEWIFNNLAVNAEIKLESNVKEPEQERILIIKPTIKNKQSTVLATTLSSESTIDIKNSYSGIEQEINGLVLDFIYKKPSAKKRHKITTSISINDKRAINAKFSREGAENIIRGVFITPKTDIDLSERFNSVQINKKLIGIIDTLKKIEPSLINLSLGTDNVIYADMGFRKLIPVNTLGNGIIKLLSVLLAMATVPDGVVFIDEIESGLHYSLQEILWDLIIASAQERK